MKVPNVGPAQRLLCAMGWHRRDPRTKQRLDFHMTAVCRGCRRSMVHHHDGWRIDRDGIRAERTGND